MNYTIPEYIAERYIPEEFQDHLAQQHPMDDTSLNISETARALGMKTFDTALPQAWVHQVTEVTGISPVGYFVWSYDGLTPEPRPVAKVGITLLEIFNYLMED